MLKRGELKFGSAASWTWYLSAPLTACQANAGRKVTSCPSAGPVGLGTGGAPLAGPTATRTTASVAMKTLFVTRGGLTRPRIAAIPTHRRRKGAEPASPA